MPEEPEKIAACRDCLFWRGRAPPIEEGAHLKHHRPCRSRFRPGFTGHAALVGPRDRVVTAPDARCANASPRPLKKASSLDPA